MSSDIDPSKPLKIEGLLDKPEPAMEDLGIFKFKDKVGRNAVRVEFGKATRPLSEALALYMVKIHGENNKIRVAIEWKPRVKPAEIKK